MITRVGIVDDKSINRNTVEQKLKGYHEIEITLQAGNGKDFLEKLKAMPATERPHVVLMDLDMPIMDGIETIRLATVAYPEIKHIVLTIFEENDKIFDAIRSGASGYLLKDDKAVNIIDAITNVVEFNGIPMSPAIARRAMNLMLGAKQNESAQKEKEAAVDLGLTERETEILKELASGSSYTVIGEKLFISPLTVRKHVSNLYEKLHVNNRTQVLNLAQKNNLI